MFDKLYLLLKLNKMELPQGLVTVVYTIILLILTTTFVLIDFTVRFQYGN